MDKRDSDLIDMLGGTKAVAELCRVRPPSVSEWRRNGIPAARRMYLELLRPDVFSGSRAMCPAKNAPREAA
jgi:hypothetical protein